MRRSTIQLIGLCTCGVVLIVSVILLNRSIIRSDKVNCKVQDKIKNAYILSDCTGIGRGIDDEDEDLVFWDYYNFEILSLDESGVYHLRRIPSSHSIVLGVYSFLIAFSGIGVLFFGGILIFNGIRNRLS